MVADIHGNAVALGAVLADAGPLQVDRWWALGDLVLFGPRPVEVLGMLEQLPNIAYVSGNTDRYVRTGQQPAIHATPAQVAGDEELVRRYSSMAGAIGWTRGALAEGGRLEMLERLPASLRTTLPDGSFLLGIHASPDRDDGPGIDTRTTDDDLLELLRGSRAPTVVGGHTHDPTDRSAAGIRALNPGSVGIPRRAGRAGWMLIEADEDGIHVDLRQVGFDVDPVVADLHARGYPNAAFIESVLAGRRAFGS